MHEHDPCAHALKHNMQYINHCSALPVAVSKSTSMPVRLSALKLLIWTLSPVSPYHAKVSYGYKNTCVSSTGRNIEIFIAKKA